MSNLSVHFSSKSYEGETPGHIFNWLNGIYGPLELDVCATPQNTKCSKFFTKEDDGLKQEWTGKCWMNPPYGRDIKHGIKKAYESSLNGATVVCLIPSRTDTSGWHDYVMKGKIIFIRGRIKFVGTENSAPFPNAVVIFSNNVSTIQEQ